MGDEKQAESLLESLRAELNRSNVDTQKAEAVLSKTKLALVQYLVPLGLENAQSVRKQLLMARETLELGALLSMASKDVKSFSRYVSQLKTYYADYSSLLPESERQWTILGLNLLGLVAHNKIGDFHTELELIPIKSQEKAYIKYPVQLEQWLMEGSYNKILQARKSIPSPSYAFFMDILVETVRDKISDCSEQAYEQLAFDEARKLLMLDSNDALRQYATKRKWVAQGDVILFARNKVEDSSADIAPMNIIERSLKYATELERIV